MINLNYKFSNVNLNFVDMNNFTLIEVGNVGLTNEKLSFSPVYLNCSFWERFYDSLALFLDSNLLSKPVVIGDLSWRIGSQQYFSNGESDNYNNRFSTNRNSKDLINNSHGRVV